MTISEHIKTNEDFDIFDNLELQFANPDDHREAEENLLWVINECNGMEPTDILQAISVVVRSYHGCVIEWDRF